MINPTVHTSPVENVLAVPQTPDLILPGELVQAHRAPAPGCRGGVEVGEVDDGEEFADEEGGDGWIGGVGDSGVGFGPYDVGFEEVGEAEVVEEEEYEVSEEAEEREGLEEEVGENYLRVTHRKTHRKIEDPRSILSFFFLERESE